MRDLQEMGKLAARVFVLDRLVSIALSLSLAIIALVAFYRILVPGLRGLLE